MSVWLQCLSQKALSPEPALSRSAAALCWRSISAELSPPVFIPSACPAVDGKLSAAVYSAFEEAPLSADEAALSCCTDAAAGAASRLSM